MQPTPRNKPPAGTDSTGERMVGSSSREGIGAVARDNLMLCYSIPWIGPMIARSGLFVRIARSPFLAGDRDRCRATPETGLRMPTTRLSAGEMESLLPDRWAVSHPDYVPQHRPDESWRKPARQKGRGERRLDRRKAIGAGSLFWTKRNWCRFLFLDGKNRTNTDFTSLFFRVGSARN